MTSKYQNIWQSEILEYLDKHSITATSSSISKLIKFLSLLEKWNKTHNLTAIKPQDYITKHVIDSLCLLPYIQGKRFIDVGTGAGFPGIPLAIFQQNCEAVLLDVSTKRCCFLKQVIYESGLDNVTVEHANIVDYNPNNSFDVVVARAFTSLSNMVNMVGHVCNREHGVILAMKAKLEESELSELSATYEVININEACQDITRCIVKINPVEHK